MHRPSAPNPRPRRLVAAHLLLPVQIPALRCGMDRPAPFRELLDAFRDGEPHALDRLIPYVYADLRRVARRHLGQFGELTIDTTGLVHETYLKLAAQRVLRADDRPHFLSICGCAMRQFVLNYVRDRVAIKRGSGEAAANIDDVDVATAFDADQIVLVDQALTRLADIDADLARVFECRYFAGLTDEETAEALGRPLRSCQRDWMRARAWVRDLLET